MDELTAPPASTSSIIPARITWPGGPSMKQFFSLPSTIIYYILKNPSSPAFYNKLSQSCKYFFENNPILVVTSLYGNTICSNKHVGGSQECCVKFDINKVSSKLWLTFELNLDRKTVSNFITLLCPKLFRCDLRGLRIENQVITFDDFKSLISSAVMVFLDRCKIMFNDDGVVMLEKIVESFSMTAKYFFFIIDNDFSMITASTMNNIAQLEKFQQLDAFDMVNIPEIVRVEDLANILKVHENISFEFDFSPDISENYMQELDDLIDTVIQSEIPHRMIIYEGQDKEKFKIMNSRFGDADISSDDDEEFDDGEELMDNE